MNRTGEKRRGMLGAALVGALTLLLLVPPPAPASGRGIEIGFADRLYWSRDGDRRRAAFDESVEAGAGVARIVVGWESVAPLEPRDPADPDDPLYRFDGLDDSVTDATDRGLRVLLTIHAAPEWAEGSKDVEGEFPAPRGTDRPDAKSLGQFAEALARRYSGGHLPLGGGLAASPLPRVELFEPWNEPNLTGFLSPQWVGDRLYSPRLYRGMLNAVYDGVHAAQPSATVIAGATAPFGGGQRDRRQVRPLVFLRKLLCISDRKRLRATNCRRPARFDLLSHHPISPEWGPRQGALHPDNATIPEMGEIRRTLRAAERQDTVLPRGLKREVWATEFWWETSPPTELYDAPSERRQARYIADGLRQLWRQGIPVALLFQIRDDPEVTGPPRQGWGSGLLSAEGARKPSFRAARFPLVADRVAARKVNVWTRAPAAGTLVIKAKGRRGSRELAEIEVEQGEVLIKRFRLRGRAQLRARIAGERSLGWRVPANRATR